MLRRLAIVMFVLMGVVRSGSAERWLVERAGALAPEDAWVSSAAELLLRRGLAELRGVTLVGTPQVASDIATVELNRLSSAQGKVRVTLGLFARARGLIVLDVAPGAELEVRVRVIDLRQPDREKTFAASAAPDALEASCASLAEQASTYLGRAPSEAERTRMNRPTQLSRDALQALGNGVEAKTNAGRELFFKQATMVSPQSALAWYLYARQLHDAARPIEAISAYRRAIRIDDGRVACHYDLANAFFDEKRYAEAAAEYERAIALDPAHAASYENLIRALKAQKVPAATILAKVRAFATAHPKTAVVHLQTGRLLVELKRFDEAVKSFQTACDLDTFDPIVHFDLARALEQAGKEGEAFYEYKEAIKRAPNYAKALNNVAFLYEKKEKYELALFHYQQAVRFAPDYALAWNNLGILYGKRGKHRLEVEAFRHQVKLTPDDPVAHYNLGVACHQMKWYQPAIASYKKSLELRDDKLTHWQLAPAYERVGMWNLANDEWRKVLALEPTPQEKATAERHIKENEGR